MAMHIEIAGVPVLGGHIDEAFHVDGLAIVGEALEREVAGALPGTPVRAR